MPKHCDCYSTSQDPTKVEACKELERDQCLSANNADNECAWIPVSELMRLKEPRLRISLSEKNVEKKFFSRLPNRQKWISRHQSSFEKKNLGNQIAIYAGVPPLKMIIFRFLICFDGFSSESE